MNDGWIACCASSVPLPFPSSQWHNYFRTFHLRPIFSEHIMFVIINIQISWKAPPNNFLSTDMKTRNKNKNNKIHRTWKSRFPFANEMAFVERIAHWQRNENWFDWKVKVCLSNCRKLKKVLWAFLFAIIDEKFMSSFSLTNSQPNTCQHWIDWAAWPVPLIDLRTFSSKGNFFWKIFGWVLCSLKRVDGFQGKCRSRYFRWAVILNDRSPSHQPCGHDLQINWLTRRKIFMKIYLRKIFPFQCSLLDWRWCGVFISSWWLHAGNNVQNNYRMENISSTSKCIEWPSKRHHLTINKYRRVTFLLC